MLRFYATSFSASIAALQRAGATLVLADDWPDDVLRRTLKADLAEGTSHFDELPLSVIIQDQIKRLLKRVNDEDEPFDRSTYHALVTEVYNNVLRDLSQAWFLMIPASRRNLYQQYYPPFGEGVAEQFPDQAKDMAAAARCIALDEWTAAVFHLMRVLEGGIHELAAWLSVTLAKGAGEQWKNALDQIEKALREVEQQPASPRKSADLTFYSGVVAQFRWFKDAWRNHVSHARTHYDEREALEVWNHVRPFMQQLAEHKAGLS